MACSKTERIQLQSTGKKIVPCRVQTLGFLLFRGRSSQDIIKLRWNAQGWYNLLWLWAFAMIQSTSVCSTSEPWRNWHGSLMISNMINMFQLCVQMCSVCFSLHRMVPILVLFWLHDDFQSWSHDGQVLIPLWSRLWLHDRPNCDSMISADTLQLIPKKYDVSYCVSIQWWFQLWLHHCSNDGSDDGSDDGGTVSPSVSVIPWSFHNGAVSKAAPASSISNDRSSSWFSFPVFDVSCFSKRTFKELCGKVLKGERCWNWHTSNQSSNFEA